jgi:acyl carrier protein|tara:strand:- start:692 stop:919 length:228 start_codon:yes stop_codon:yes gene_type:complete
MTIETRVLRGVSRLLSVPTDTVTVEDNLYSIGIDTIGMIVLLIDLEAEFDIFIEEDDFKYVKDIVYYINDMTVPV